MQPDGQGADRFRDPERIQFNIENPGAEAVNTRIREFKNGFSTGYLKGIVDDPGIPEQLGIDGVQFRVENFVFIIGLFDGLGRT